MMFIFKPFVWLFNLIMRILTLNLWGRKSRKREKLRKQRLKQVLQRDDRLQLTEVYANDELHQYTFQNIMDHFMVDEKSAKFLTKLLKKGERVYVLRPRVKVISLHYGLSVNTACGVFKDTKLLEYSTTKALNKPGKKLPSEIHDYFMSSSDSSVRAFSWRMTNNPKYLKDNYPVSFYWEYSLEVVGNAETISELFHAIQESPHPFSSINTNNSKVLTIIGDNVDESCRGSCCFENRDSPVEALEEILKDFKAKKKGLRALHVNTGNVLKAG